jgi:hypothetical protein
MVRNTHGRMNGWLLRVEGHICYVCFTSSHYIREPYQLTAIFRGENQVGGEKQ